ncbi:COP9 signalosome complex subunit 7b [Dermacentor andersoni]|uniref:COP9 signalosome complex subunit 7b n=1 Tax=Dermacentor andersoni TaxID=34620 RepID=UPI002155431E|nr:COP9 signalosome complex subunit 7b-like [Dermacentor andersoni]
MGENKTAAAATTTVMQSSQLEQYLLLAKTAKGAAAAELIKQVTEAPGVHVFGELLDMPNIQELANGPHSSYLNLLNLFAFGTYATYHENKSQFPPLTPAMITKLRHLTIVSLATKTKCIPYSTLLKELDMKNLRELEDLIIDVIYADVVRGKLDQKNNQLEVDYTIGRDIRPEDVSTIIRVLQEWCTSCETVVNSIECQIARANAMKDSHMKLKQHIDNEVANIKKNLKVQSQDVDDQMGADGREDSHMDKPGKKASKSKGLPHQSRR